MSTELTQAAEETTLTKLVKSISGSLDKLNTVESSVTDLVTSVSKKYEDKLKANLETLTLDEVANHFKLITSMSLAILDTKRKLLIKGIADPEPASKELLDMFKVVNTPEKRAALTQLLKSFAESENLDL